MEVGLLIITFVVFAAVTLLFSRFLPDAHKQRIQKELAQHGATEIEVTREWPDTDRDNFTYLVTYKDAQGQVRNNLCKIHIALLGNAHAEISWRDPL